MTEGQDAKTMDKDLAARVAAHERDIANLTGAVESLSDSLRQTADAQWQAIREQGSTLRSAIEQQGVEVRNDINSLGTKLSDSQAVSWPFVVSVVIAGLGVTSLAVTVMTIIGSMALSPINDRLAEHIHDEHPHESEKQIIELRAQTAERFSDVETQFRGLQIQNNLLHQQSYILLNASRREAGLPPLDFPKFWPAPKNQTPLLSPANRAGDD